MSPPTNGFAIFILLGGRGEDGGPLFREEDFGSHGSPVRPVVSGKVEAEQDMRVPRAKANQLLVKFELSLCRKDNTLGLILDTLNSLNVKVDRVLHPASPHSTGQNFATRSSLRLDPRLSSANETADFSSRPSGGHTEHQLFSLEIDDTLNSEISYTPSDTSLGIPSFQVPQRQTTEVHKLLQWPAVQNLLQSEGVDVSRWQGDSKGTEGWLIEVTKAFGYGLPLDRPIDILYADGAELDLDTEGSITLNKEYVEGLCEAYFQSFHCMYPILDRKLFYVETLPRVLRQSFSEAQEGSSLVLLVLALGSITEGSLTSTPILDSGRDTGIRGGTPERPPGLVFLNEAKRRFGISLTNWSLVNLETCILCSMYYSQISRNMVRHQITEGDLRKLTFISGVLENVTSELYHVPESCEKIWLLSRYNSVSQWRTAQSDRISRCYWMCTILEGGLTGELGLELPGITAIQDSVPLPIFLSDETALKDKTDNDFFIEYHFLAQITLRSLINRARNSSREMQGTLLQERAQWPVARATVIEELSTQLENWRLHLPALISFTEEDLHDSEAIVADALTQVNSIAMGRIDIRMTLRAILRTRYKYAQYVIWRPYIYQVLHVQRDHSLHNIESSIVALKVSWAAAPIRNLAENQKACTMWPLTFTAFQSQRRLVPHLYEYTHTIFGILILLHACSLNPILGPIMKNSPAAYEIELSVNHYLSWIRDMKVVHPVAKWAWYLIKVIYKDHAIVQEEHLQDDKMQSGQGLGYSSNF
ncbi:hypothetical protein BP6252_07085 [Coleophoma cylindrospora]|uniref:Transcription factor domain-containing protein n=1 Tax=Coleophoma cylindrospora TaxID=1849047 RepID=A0A3D8RGX2_9HELO|nr:hypothetical protein BP6252_07085 [Coleophoma cylindrospora]